MRGKEIRDRSGDSRKGHHNVRHTLLLSPPTDGDVSERGKGQLILRRFRLPLSRVPSRQPTEPSHRHRKCSLPETDTPSPPQSSIFRKRSPQTQVLNRERKICPSPFTSRCEEPWSWGSTGPHHGAHRSCCPKLPTSSADSLHQVPLQRWPPTGHRVCYNFNSHKDLRRLAPISPF